MVEEKKNKRDEIKYIYEGEELVLLIRELIKEMKVLGYSSWYIGIVLAYVMRALEKEDLSIEEKIGE